MSCMLIISISKINLINEIYLTQGNEKMNAVIWKVAESGLKSFLPWSFMTQTHIRKQKPHQLTVAEATAVDTGFAIVTPEHQLFLI